MSKAAFCPSCRVIPPNETRCTDCGAELGWLYEPFFQEFCTALCRSFESNHDTERTPCELDALAGSPVWFDPAPRSIVIGRRDSSNNAGLRIVLPVSEVDLDHAYAAWDGTQLWIIDVGSTTGTFINRRSIRSGRLHPGDLLQIGPYAWQFSKADVGEAYLQPVKQIDGVSLRLRGISLPGRLEPVDLDIAPGEFLAIIGPSGGGKSTLISSILAPPQAGMVYFNDHDAALKPELFRSTLGYVSQKETLHGDLTASDAVRFAGELRDVHNVETLVQRLLDEGEVPYQARRHLCRQLSGGESKRVRVASQLISCPKLLILDEPGSGLDRDRERKLMRALRTLSYRGCTVILVTHGLHELEEVDRILVMADKEARFVGAPAELCKTFGLERIEGLDFGDLQQMSLIRKSNLPPVEKNIIAATLATANLETQRDGFSRQFKLLFKRELAVLIGSPIKRLFMPILVMPLLFGLALMAVGYGTNDLFLFLITLSAIWMGSALSLLSIADEWEIVEHEHLLFLRPAAYVAAKYAALSIIGMIQALMFCAILILIERWGNSRGYEDSVSGLWPIFLITLASIGMGMCISAIVKGNSRTANLILPLVMLCQIVFSAHIGRRQGEPILASHQSVYDDFKITTLGRNQQPESQENSLKSTKEPTRLAVYGSYITLSRHADELLSETARGGSAAWRKVGWQPIVSLVGAILGFPIVAWLLVRYYLTFHNRLMQWLSAK